MMNECDFQPPLTPKKKRFATYQPRSYLCIQMYSPNASLVLPSKLVDNFQVICLQYSCCVTHTHTSCWRCPRKIIPSDNLTGERDALPPPPFRSMISSKVNPRRLSGYRTRVVRIALPFTYLKRYHIPCSFRYTYAIAR